MPKFLSKIVPLLTFPLLVLTLSCAPAKHAVTPELAQALPAHNETLAQPIVLAHCPMRIVEWRPSAKFPETRPTATAIEAIDRACADALENYPKFLATKRLASRTSLNEALADLPDISLLPANILVDGKDARSLNDVTGRFAGAARICCYWGLYVNRINHLFVRNDPVEYTGETRELRPNRRFLRTLYHELAHVLNAHLSVREAENRERDEALAEEFVDYLGFDFPTESSSQDLAFREENHASLNAIVGASGIRSNGRYYQR